MINSGLIFIFLIICIQYIGLYQKKDFWPFSHFPMYSTISSQSHFNWIKLEYKVDNKKYFEFDDSITFPYYNVRFKYAFIRQHKLKNHVKSTELIKLIKRNIKNKWPDVEYIKLSIQKYYIDKESKNISIITDTVVFYENYK